VVEVRRHNAGFCRDCFFHHCREQIRRTIDDFGMTHPGERVLVAVSGGKDSLALWDILLDLGHDADGLYLGLGIGDYSDESGRYARAFADARGAKLHEVDLRDRKSVV
jgi:tRNA(Ile)-lysidine synthase TilS/MesJ